MTFAHRATQTFGHILYTPKSRSAAPEESLSHDVHGRNTIFPRSVMCCQHLPHDRTLGRKLHSFQLRPGRSVASHRLQPRPIESDLQHFPNCFCLQITNQSFYHQSKTALRCFDIQSKNKYHPFFVFFLHVKCINHPISTLSLPYKPT